MHLKSRLLSITAAGGVAALAFGMVPVTQVFAGAGTAPSADCANNTGAVNQVLVSTPIYLAVSVHAGELAGTGNYASVCYSDPPAGQNSDLAGGVAGVFYPVPQPYGESWCASDPTALVQVSCGVGVWPTSNIVYGPCGNASCGANTTVAVPFGWCLGTNLSGGSCIPAQQGPALGATGVFITTLGVGSAPSGTAEGATAAPAGTLYVDGVIQQDFAGLAGAGANVGAGSGSGGTPVCAVICVTVPPAWAGLPAGPTPLGVIQIGTASLSLPNVLTAPACVSEGMSCPTPY